MAHGRRPRRPHAVEVSKKKPDDIVGEMILWADHPNPNIRRTASEGLRDAARKNPALVLPVILKLKADPNLYVKKSVANVIRNAVIITLSLC